MDYKKTIINKLDEMRLLFPELRFGQMINNFIVDTFDEDADFFYMSDYDIYMALSKYIDSVSKVQETRRITKLIAEDDAVRKYIMECLRDGEFI